MKINIVDARPWQWHNPAHVLEHYLKSLFKGRNQHSLFGGWPVALPLMLPLRLKLKQKRSENSKKYSTKKSVPK